MIFFEIVKGWFSSLSPSTPVTVTPDDATQQHTIENATVVRLFAEQPKQTLFDGVFQITAFDDVAQVTLFEE